MTIRGNFTENETMKWLSHTFPMSGDSKEYQMVCDILKGYGINDNVSVLTYDDILWLANAFVSVGKSIGISEERARRKYGNKKTSNR